MTTEEGLAETVAALKKERDELRRSIANTQAGLVLALVVSLVAVGIASYGVFVGAPGNVVGARGARTFVRADTVEARSFLLRDERGRIRAELTTGTNTDPTMKEAFGGSSSHLTFNDEAGSCALTLGQNERGGNFLNVLGKPYEGPSTGLFICEEFLQRQRQESLAGRERQTALRDVGTFRGCHHRRGDRSRVHDLRVVGHRVRNRTSDAHP